jgi:hypothetical protein
MSDDKRTCTISPDLIVPLFYPDAPAALAEQARLGFGIQGSLPLAAKVNFAAPVLAAVPRSYVLCTRDRVIPLHHQRRMLAADPACGVLELASDHSPFYSQPETLVALLKTCCLP